MRLPFSLAGCAWTFMAFVAASAIAASSRKRMKTEGMGQ